jgi:hypothetical protein
VAPNWYWGFLTIMSASNITVIWRKNIRQYAAAPRVEALRQGTTLHKIIMQFEDIKKPLDFDEKV